MDHPHPRRETLEKADATSRLAALTLILHAHPTTGTGQLPDLDEQTLTTLTPTWISLLDDGSYQLTEAAADHLPIYQPTPPA
ncbi:MULTISPECIES: hypothetical protein [Frankia]|uniref:Uncharacterized protein n=1 Tax=Frankia alni (strain DSM 45986 / CECT 9034 / ACN14a) TaxID=326424 RepID=Q0RTF5_FRAAA|nr:MULTISPECIES: hypothetical protein [Frankia]CAJ59144.1 conserved hypothetical protein [Frankia alni ACN14a]